MENTRTGYSKKRYELWDDFLKRWPIDKLEAMTLEEYSQVGNPDSFTNWLEIKTSKLGSIKGGSSFKFGLFERKQKERKEPNRGRVYGERYAWLSNLGETPEQSYAVVHDEIVRIANCARSGLLEQIDGSVFGPIVTWKIAFLYQDRKDLKILPVYLQKFQNAFLKSKKLSSSEAQRRLVEKLGDQDIFEFAKQIWSVASKTQDDSDDANDELSGDQSVFFDQPLNQILYGPPGTGKTYESVSRAVGILDPQFYKAHINERAELKQRFDQLSQLGRIRFVTFHQSFSYEDFVEGLRAEIDDDGQLRYEVTPGIFKSLCDSARTQIQTIAEIETDLSKSKVWKMSLGVANGDDSYIYDECIESGVALLGWGGGVDISSCNSTKSIFEHLRAAGNEGLKETDYANQALNLFKNKMQTGDLIVLSDGNLKFRAIGEVSGEYRHIQRDDDTYSQSRNVRWLRTYDPSLPAEQLIDRRFSQRSLYELPPKVLNRNKLSALIDIKRTPTPLSEKPSDDGLKIEGYPLVDVTDELIWLRTSTGSELPIPVAYIRQLRKMIDGGIITEDDIKNKKVFEKSPDTNLEKYLVNGYPHVFFRLVKSDIGKGTEGTGTGSPSNQKNNDAYVLIIDEINRGNISKIFGELITLIEESKRTNSEETLDTILPYSKEKFSVPNNVFLIGTMNTADRSLATVDIALRRRFSFVELPPCPELLKDVLVEGLPIDLLLETLNQRIELLLDRDHRLGHAYFLPLKNEPNLLKLSEIFQLQIIPLLEEYFFEDWEQIRLVLNDHRKADLADQFVRASDTSASQLFGEQSELAIGGDVWQLNQSAFGRISAYAGVIEPT